MISKILVVNVNWVGDVLFSSPIFRALKKTYPQASICCLALPRVREILEMNPFVDEIIIYDERREHFSPLGKWKLVCHLRSKKFDIAFLLHRSWTRAFLVLLAGIPQRVGYDAKQRGWMLTHKVEPLSASSHRSDHYLNVIESYGIPVADRSCILKIESKENSAVDDLLKEKGVAADHFVVINPGGNWDLKRWPKENFSSLIDKLSKEPNVKIVISGASKDSSLAQEIIKSCFCKPISLVGKTNLKQLAALMARADCVISADSGPLHIANCAGARTIALFGPTSPKITGPRGKGKYVILRKDIACNGEPCYQLDCKDNICMKSITVDDVVNEFRKIRD